MKIQRRSFVAGMGAAGAVLPLRSPWPELDLPPEGEAATAPEHFTPYGYLDNPFHAWELHPSGVLRSVEAMGIGFYVPAGPGGYFDYAHAAVYQASLRIGVAIGSKILLDADDFASGQLFASHHSKNVLSFAFAHEGVQFEAAFLQVGEDTLAARVRVRGAGAARVRVAGLHTYHLGARSWWGRDGLTAGFNAATGAITARSFAAGTVFRLCASHPITSRLACAHAMDQRRFLAGAPVADHDLSYYPDPIHAGLLCSLTAASEPQELWFHLTRAPNRPEAQSEQERAVATAPGALAAKLAQDAHFWAAAPRLEGDWPEHWRRGWVYDFETLRMIVRRPLGVYKHPWDGMQIQAPRNVLAETSLDMWALSYADPDTARTVLLGQFQDALAANLPCMRENGAMNMVAADGSACGTSIAWCYPFFCIESVLRRGDDAVFARAIYPQLARFLRWTLAHRADRDGYIVGKCSWETGMDASSRFQIAQPTGAESIEFIRVVELQAATAHAAGVLSDLAAAQQLQQDAAEWRQLQAIYTAKTQALWNGSDWFEDFDARDQKPIAPPPPTGDRLNREVGQAAPVFLGQATAAQTAAMLPLLREYPSHPAYYLEWPSLVLPYLESLWTAGDRALAAEVVAGIAERVFASTDRREIGHGLGWPGVSCEMWGLEGAHGGEGYGWGATLPAHILRSIVGFRESATGLELCPNLPAALALPGKRYAVRNLQFRGDVLDLEYRVLHGGRIAVAGQWRGGRRFTLEARNHEPFPAPRA